jgi:hypothetical protein
VAPWCEAQAQIWCMTRKCKSSGKVLIYLDASLCFENIEKLIGPTGLIRPSIDSLRGASQTELDTAHPETLPDLISQIKTFAFPFFDALSTLDRLFTTLQSSDKKDWFWAGPIGRIELIAATMAIKGQKQAALELLDSEIIRLLKSHPEPYATLTGRQALQNCRNKIADYSDF